MNLKELLYWYHKICDVSEEIFSFYDNWSEQQKQSGRLMRDDLLNGDIDFTPLLAAKEKERAFYQVFAEEPQLFSFLLKQIIPLELNPDIFYSSILPEYRKNKFNDLMFSPFIARIRNQLINYKNDYSNIEIEEQLLGSMDIDSYHFSHVAFQNSEIIQRLIKEEFQHIFLIYLQNNIDIRQLSLPDDVEATSLLMGLERNILIQNSTLEDDFIENYFVYEDPFELTATHDLLEMGVSNNAICYFNEEFAKEQGKDAIHYIMTTPVINVIYELEFLYLKSSITQMREETSFQSLQDFFTQNYIHQTSLPLYREKRHLILDVFANKKEIRAGFCYKK